MTSTKQTVAEKIASYLRHDISRADLVSWAEDAMVDGEKESEMVSALEAVSGVCKLCREPRNLCGHHEIKYQ